MSVSVENFVKTVYNQQHLSEADTKLSTIARILKISNTAATDMARKLSAKNLVNYIKYKPVSLTDSGKKLALNVLRKHRLWESFLYETLELSLHEIHCEAENLEHFTSDFLANKIEQYLDNPSVDPHGDPIPSKKGVLSYENNQISLMHSIAGKTYEVLRLNSSDKDFFDFCAANQINVGTKIGVEKQFLNGMTEINIGAQKMLLNNQVTNVIYVKQTID